MADPTTLPYTSAPGYLKSADLHNLANGNESFFSEDYLTSIPGRVAKYSIGSIISGANSIYNSAVGIGNFFGADIKESDTGQLMSSLDTDLGKYYQQNTGAVNLGGFVAGSALSGLSGLRLFNAGQKALGAAMETGSIGSRFAQATGLVPTIETSIKASAADFAASGAKFSFANANVLLTVGKGFQQAAWESAAFETAVAATLYKSPILEGQDYKDLATNIGMGALIGGAIGGAFSIATSYGKISRELKIQDFIEKPVTARTTTEFLGEDHGSRLVAYANDLDKTPSDAWVAERGLESKMDLRTRGIQNDIRYAGMQLATGGSENEAKKILGGAFSDNLLTLDADTLSGVGGGLKRVGSVADTKLGENEIAAYFPLHGPNAGKLTLEPPGIQTLADEFKTPDRIDAFVKTQNFSVKADFNPITAGTPGVVQARYMWAESLKPGVIKNGQEIFSLDIPMMEAALRSDAEFVNVTYGADFVEGIPNTTWTAQVPKSQLQNEVIQAKRELAVELNKAKRAGWSMNEAASTITTQDIAQIANVSPEFLESTENASAFFRQDSQAAYLKKLEDAGVKQPTQTNLDYVPRNIALVYKSAPVLDQTVQVGMQNVRILQNLNASAVSTVLAKHMQELAPQIVRLTDTDLMNANRFGAGSGLISFANGGYGTVASAMEQNGKVTANLIKKFEVERAAALDSPLLRIQADPQSAIHVFSLNNEALKASGFDRYVLKEDGSGFVLSKVAAYEQTVKDGKAAVYPEIPEGIKPQLPFPNMDVADTMKALYERNSYRVGAQNDLAKASGLEESKNTLGYYPYRPNPADYKFFAFVKDPTVVGQGLGHTSMIHAATEEQLQQMVGIIRNTTPFEVYFKSETEAYYKARMEYDFGKTLHENYIDSTLASKGVNTYALPKTDPQIIVDEIRNWETRRDSQLARDLMAAGLSKEFNQFDQLGSQFTAGAASTYGGTLRGVASSVQNPYMDYAKTALNISRLSEYPIWSTVNQYLEKAVGTTYSKIADAFKLASGSQESIEQINGMLEKAGISHAYGATAELLTANHTAPKPVLSNFIRGVNSVLATTFLRADFLNPINNAVGNVMLLGKETRSLIQGIRNSDQDTAGALSSLLDLQVPGVKDTIASPAKLIARQVAKFVQGDPELETYVAANGWGGKGHDLYKSMLQDISLVGNESAAVLNSKLQTIFAKGQALSDAAGKYTGNDFAEGFNRFIAVGVAKDLTDLGVQAGILTPQSQLAYVNTFLNRTQGNIIASQRPLLFQGPIGQAVGLFQSYQFNVLQQIFRGVAEGGAKDAAFALGLQSTIYGMNGLPAFQYINQHIIGTASGNKEHTDAYSKLYGDFGKTAGDWLMYGIPSNLLQTNIYSRGDINPRQLTVIPVNPKDIPAVSAISNFAANLFETTGKLVTAGANGSSQSVWQTILQGIEHNQLSRPLAGLAATTQAALNPGNKSYSTTNGGDVSFVADFASMATLSRLAGGKPLDEALAADFQSRMLAYQTVDSNKRKAATELFKNSVIGNQVPTQDAVNLYLKQWIDSNGRQQDFNKAVLSAITKANTPKANEVIRHLKTPYSQQMQALLGGSEATLFDQ